jgi:hypothetical protein
VRDAGPSTPAPQDTVAAERVRAQTQQPTDEENELRQTVDRQQQVIASQREEIRTLSHLVTQLALAAAVLTHDHVGALPAKGNVVSLRPGKT